MSEPAGVTVQHVHFKNGTIRVSALLYAPEGTREKRGQAAVIVGHPFGGVKEQAASLYAQKLAEHQFTTLAFDASYCGKSGGKQRFLEDPATRVEDFRCAVDYLMTLDFIDEERIGALGLCAGGSYAISAAQTESRIQAVAAVSLWDMGAAFRKGLYGDFAEETREQLLQAVGMQRTREARGEPVKLIPIVPDRLEQIDKTMTLTREFYEYYCSGKGDHPIADNRFMFTSLDRIMAFFPFVQIETIAPRPLLLIAGEKSEMLCFSHNAYRLACEPKELFLIPGATHVGLCGKTKYVMQAVKKLAGFFAANL